MMDLLDPICRHPRGLPEEEQRVLVVQIARTWIGTPYHHNAAVKGGGVDCGRIMIEVMAEANLVDRFDPGYYAPDWHCHRNEERYMATLEQHCKRVDDDERSIEERGPDFSVLPGNFIMFKCGRTYSHAGIVTDWANIVHAAAGERIVFECDILRTTMCKRRMMVFSFWGR